MRVRLAVVAVAALVAMGLPSVQAAARAVSFPAADGRIVNALINEAAQPPAAAVVLVPMLGRPKDDWQVTGQRLADVNITALMLDLPGTSLPSETAALLAWGDDIRAAIDFLQSRPETRSGAIGLAGASLGGSLAAAVASSDQRVRSLLLLSPSLDYRGVRIENAVRQYGERPAMFIASRQDPYAARSARALAEDPPGIRELQWSDLAAHGTALLTREPDLLQALVTWFQRTLG
ncbi:MAG: alpha/beta fold hydrolase [Vicinamibacterales bacterium]